MGGAEAAERETRPTTRLVNQSLVGHGPEDLFQRIPNRQHEARCELLKASAGIHEGGGIGEKIEPGHQIVECPGDRLFSSRSAPRTAPNITALCLRNVFGNTRKHLGWCFDDVALLVLRQVAVLEDGQGIVRHVRHVFLDARLHRFFPHCLRQL